MPPLVLDTGLAALASRQHGVLSRSQLREHLSRAQLRRRREMGVFHPYLGDTFLVAGAPATRRSAMHAALLSVPGACLGGHSAAEVLRLPLPHPPSPEIIVPSGYHRDIPGVRLRQRGDVAARHRTEIDGLATTTLPRTVLDLACDLDLRSLASLVDGLTEGRRLDLRVLADEFEGIARQGRNGTTILRAVIEPRLCGLTVARSELESRGRRFLRAHGFPDPLVEFHPPWAGPAVTRVDLAWPEFRLIIELDGRRWHDTADRFESDRLRDQLAAANGWLVVRVTWRQLHDDPIGVVKRLRATFEARSAV